MLKFEGKLPDGLVFEKTQPNLPALVAPGSGQVIPGLDSAIIGSKVGVEKKIHLSPDQAFGPRKEDLLRLVPIQQFRASGVDPKPGQVVELDNVPAKIMSVAGGRVRVDFNHELAGKEIDYTFTVESRFTTPLAKLQAAAKNFIQSEASEATLTGSTARVSVGTKVNKDPNYFIAKTRMVAMVLANVPEITKVEILEAFELEKAEPAKKPAPAQGKAAASGN